MKRATEIRQMTNPELAQAIQDAKEEMFNLRFQSVITGRKKIRRNQRAPRNVLSLSSQARPKAITVQAMSAPNVIQNVAFTESINSGSVNRSW